MNSGDTLKLIGMENYKKFGKNLSPFRVYVDEHDSFTLSEPVEQFDFDVLCIGISEYYVGNRYLTPGIVCRRLTGKVDDRDAKPGKDQFVTITHSIGKIMFLGTQLNIAVKSGNVGNGSKKNFGKATISDFDVRGVKMGVDFKSAIIAAVNVKAVEFHVEVFGRIDEVSFFAGSVTFSGRAIVSVGILIVFRQVFGAISFCNI